MAEIIRESDPAAICTRKGWEKWSKASAKKRAKIRTKGGPAVPNACLWIAGRDTPDNAQRFIAIECERYYDAVRVARHVLCADVALVSISVTLAELVFPPTRVQVRWEGSAARRVSDLRLQFRHIRRDRAVTEWQDLA